MGTLPAGFLGAMFLAGLMGGLHCAGMCGGILGATSAGAGTGALPRQVAIHAGRIGSYALLGALMAGLGGASGLVADLAPVQLTLYVLANVLLLATGAYLLGWRAPMTWVETRGGGLWRRIAPLTRRILPVRSVPQGLALGAMWGFMPCGLVYGALAMALLSADPLAGAALMAAFGLGTLPNLLAVGVFLRRGVRSARRVLWQRAAGIGVLGFGAWGLVHAAQGGAHLRNGLLCVTAG